MSGPWRVRALLAMVPPYSSRTRSGAPSMKARSLRRTRTAVPTAAILALLTLLGCAPGERTRQDSDTAAPGGGEPAATVFPAANRPDVRGTVGAVSAGHPLAAAAGYEVLRGGGNAVDAVLAMAGVLAVVRPHMNGVGGDAFGLIYWKADNRVYGLNGSGRTGALATANFFRERTLSQIPETGALSVTVPGAVGAWVAASERFGTRPLGDLLDPAVRYARDGFPVSSRLYRDMEEQSGALNQAGRALYLPGGSPPAVGSLLRNPALASTLELIAEHGAAGFYEGPVAQALARFVESEGGYLRARDFPILEPTWVEPLDREYLGYRFFVLPPNTQGMAQIQMMEIAKSLGISDMKHNTSRLFHTMIEVKKLAFADRNQWVADPDFAPAPLDRLLDPAYLAERASEVDPGRAAEAVSAGVAPATGPGAGEGGQDGGPTGLDDSGDTVYLTAVDRWGNAVSWIQSLFHGFGSGLYEPETGVLLHNRGSLFTLEEGHPNVVEPGKRPYHTLTPTMALRDGELGFTLGTPGGDGQLQTILQIVHNLALFGMTPQEAIEAPRFRSYPGLRVAIEDRVGPDVRAELAALGHEIEVIHGWTATFGGAQMIFRDPVSGTLAAAADPRREAYALAY